MIRQATENEHLYYREKLYPLMDKVLASLKTEKFYLSGGTCLSRFYFHHRYSDDLDFFFNGKKYDKYDFDAEFNYIFNTLDFEKKITMNGEYFKRMLIHQDDFVLKLEFIYENFEIIGQQTKHHSFWLDSKKNVAANKITAIYGRKTYKDYYDLFFLLKELDFDEVFENAQKKMVPLNYEETLMVLKNGEMSSPVLTIGEFDKEAYNNFIQDLQKKILSNAKNNKSIF